MIRTTLTSFGLVLCLLLLGVVAQAQNGINASGNWNVTASGETFATGTLKLEQVESTVVGTYGHAGRLDGSVRPDSRQVDATWNDSRGTGWLTIVFTADGNGFSGEWGYAGRKPSGRFVASRVMPVYPPVSGLFNVSVTGGPEFVSRVMSLHQLGQTVVGNFGPGTQLGGTRAADGNNLTGTWKGPRGDGWLNLRFASDSRSFQGEWGLMSDTRPQGQIIGTILNHTQLWVRGLWDVATSGGAFSSGELRLQQEGQTVIGSYKGGHLQGTLPRGSAALSGRWRDAAGAGDLTLKFSSDGKSFQGTWTRGKTSGRIIGKRVIASSPALR